MSPKGIILVIIFISFSITDACKSTTSNKWKVKTSSQTFLKLRSDQTTQCRFINRDFHELEGKWYFVVRSVTSKTPPEMRCGYLDVHTMIGSGFTSKLSYMTNNGETVTTAITGLFINETIVGVPELNDIIVVYPELRQPYFVQIGLCDGGTVFFMEPIYYMGGSMVFTRNVPKSITALKLRFGTYDEQRGKELMMQIPLNCTV